MSQPWMKFYPSDWRADPVLRMCSIGARGIWIEMLALMHEANPRGFLLVNGKPITDKQLAGLVSTTLRETAGYVAELEDAGVFSRDDRGTIYSRRMRRDDEKAARDKANGRWGGNPILAGVNPRVNPPDDPPVNPQDNPPVKGGDKAQIPDTRSQKDDGGGDARARASPISAEANRLADEIMTICGIDQTFVPPGWCGAPMRIQAWIAQGWSPGIILIAVRKAMARKRDGTPDSVSYFEKPIVREMSLQSAPLPTARIIPIGETVDVSTPKSGRLIEARDRILARLDQAASTTDRPAARQIRGDAGDSDARLLPKR